MALRSRLKVQLYQWNLERVRAGEKPVSVLELAQVTGIAYSAVRKLLDNKSTRIDFETIDRLMRYFGTDNLNDILEYSPDPPRA